MVAAGSLSVLMPVHNGARFLEESLASLARQTFTDFETVVVDDGSTDDTGRILEHWRSADSRVRLVRQAHSGLVAALNAGLEHCGGDLVARMDADDVALPRRFELQRQALLERPQIDVLGCRVEHFAQAGVGEGFRIYEEWLNDLLDDADIRRDRFIESPIAHPSAMVRRRALTSVDGYRDRGWPEDYDLWLRLAAAGCRFAKLPVVLHRWRDHPRRLTRADPRYAVERFLECKAHHLAHGPLRDASRVVVWGAGQTGRRLSKHLLRRHVPIAAFVDIDSRKQGRSLRGRPVVAPTDLERMRLDQEPLLVLAAVASRGARAKIRGRLQQQGFTETEDFWCVA